MYLNANMPESGEYNVIDLDTGLKIFRCLSANDETGEYLIYVCDEEGNPKYSGQDYLIEKRKGNIKLVKRRK